MALRAALLKSIWYAFTSLDTEDSGKVSKSQLKVRQMCVCVCALESDRCFTVHVCVCLRCELTKLSRSVLNLTL